MAANSTGSKNNVGSSLPSKESLSDESSSSQEEDSQSSSDGESSEESSVNINKSKKKNEESSVTSSNKGKTTKNDVIPAKSKVQRRASAQSSERSNSLAPSLYDDEQAYMMRRRSSTASDKSRGSVERAATSKPIGNGPNQIEAKAESKKTAKASWGKIAKAVKKESESDIDDVFSNVLLAAKKLKEEKRRQSISDDNSNGTDLFSKVLKQAKDIKEEKQAKMAVDNNNSNVPTRSEEHVGSSDNGNKCESGDEEFEAPKLVYERKSKKHLFDTKFEDTESSGSDDSSRLDDEPEDRARTGARSMSQDNEGEEESNEESSSEEESEAASLSTESSRDEEDYSDEEKISSDEEDVLSTESQMSILTPIAEESVTSPGNGHTSDDSSSSSEDDSISDDLENGENSINDQSEQDETASPNNVSQNGSTGAEAMLTDMPDENSIALAKRKAVQNVMTNKSLTAIERNKRIQDIMAGKVELPKVPTTSSQNLSNETTDSFQKASGSKAGIDASQNGQRKENRSSKKKSSENGGTNGLAKKIEPSTISVAKEKPTRKMKISFGSTRNIISPQHTVQSQCSIFEFDNNVDQKNQVELMKVFQDTLSLAESSTDKSSDQKALLTAMTYTLHELDSQWNLGTFSTSPKSNLVHKSMKCTLGKRERISPYSDHLITRGDDPVNWKSLFVGITPGSTQPRTQKKTSFDLPVKINRRTCDSIENMIKKPRKPSRELTRATFDIKKSAVIEKISMNLLLEPPSDDEESDDDTGQNIGKLHKWFTSITK